MGLSWVWPKTISLTKIAMTRTTDPSALGYAMLASIALSIVPWLHKFLAREVVTAPTPVKSMKTVKLRALLAIIVILAPFSL
jgi:hypothetical protein